MTHAIDWNRTALLLVDPQIDVLSPEGAAWDLVGEQVTKQDVAGKLRRLRDEAERCGVTVLYSWIRVTEADYAAWSSCNGLQQLMADRKMMLPDRGGRFVAELEPTSKSVLLIPRMTPSPSRTDLTLQLRQRDIDGVVVAGMIANLCVESHVRELTDSGYRAIVVEDAVATTDDASLAATLADFKLIATDLLSSSAVLASLQAGARQRAQVA